MESVSMTPEGASGASTTDTENSPMNDSYVRLKTATGTTGNASNDLSNPPDAGLILSMSAGDILDVTPVSSSTTSLVFFQNTKQEDDGGSPQRTNSNGNGNIDDSNLNDECDDLKASGNRLSVITDEIMVNNGSSTILLRNNNNFSRNTDDDDGHEDQDDQDDQDDYHYDDGSLSSMNQNSILNNSKVSVIQNLTRAMASSSSYYSPHLRGTSNTFNDNDDDTMSISTSQTSNSILSSASAGSQSVVSEWDKALQSGKPFLGRTDANKLFSASSPNDASNIKRQHKSKQQPKHLSGHATRGSSHLNPVPEEDISLPNNNSSGECSNSHPPTLITTTTVSAISNPTNTTSTVSHDNPKLDQESDLSNQGVNTNQERDQEKHQQSGLSSTQSSPSSNRVRSHPNVTATTQNTGSITVTSNNNNNNSYHYPVSLQHRPHTTQQRRPSIGSVASTAASTTVSGASVTGPVTSASVTSSTYGTNDNLSAGVLPDVLMTVRQKIESFALFDSDMLRMLSVDVNSTNNNSLGPMDNGSAFAGGSTGIADDADAMLYESRESLKRSSQQSISAAVLVSLAHKRYERRRLAAMEIEKVVRSLVTQHQQHQNNLKKQQQQQSHAATGDQALERIRAILLLLSDDYVRSTSEDARKGGVVALAACAIGLKKADDSSPTVQECRDLILASVVHACQDHSQRVRYYATESLFNVVKVIPSLAVQHFFILFEILRSLYADVDIDVRSGAELLDKKLKEIIVGAMNAGIFTADACVPVFSRFVFMKHKATKRLTLTWLQELNEKLIGSPILEFLHLFLGGIFDMVADPTVGIRQSALAFLQSVLPKLLVVKHGLATAVDAKSNVTSNPSAAATSANVNSNSMFDNLEDIEMNVVDFDKILQSLVTTMEHPNPFVRKVAMYWMSRILKAHMSVNTSNTITAATNEVVELNGESATSSDTSKIRNQQTGARNVRSTFSKVNSDHGGIAVNRNIANRTPNKILAPPSATSSRGSLSAASISVHNSVPHVLPGILLSIGDNYHYNSLNPNNGNNPVTPAPKDSFLPDQTTRDLAEQTNACLQEAVRRDGAAYVQHLDGFIMALREELDSPGGFTAKNSPAAYRTPYRMDVLQDGTGIETNGWFRSSRDGNTPKDAKITDEGIVMSRLCALQWVIVLYESVVPDPLKADYAREFIFSIIHQLADHAPQSIIHKSLEVLAKITIPVVGEEKPKSTLSSHALSGFGSPAWMASSVSWTNTEYIEDQSDSTMSDSNVTLALKFLDEPSRRLMSRDREVFSSLVQLFSYNEHLLADLSNIVTYMCKLQPPAFVIVSFAVELDRYVRRQQHRVTATKFSDQANREEQEIPMSKDLRFVSSFIQHMNHVLLNTDEAKDLRDALNNCVGKASKHQGTISERDRQLSRLFNILLHAFSHNIAATLSLCLWTGAYSTAYLFITRINPLDINLMFLLEIDRLVEMLERPLFRHLHIRMLECDQDSKDEGSGAMLFQFLKCLLMVLPQSTCYRVLRDRLTSLARFRQSTGSMTMPVPFGEKKINQFSNETIVYVTRIREIRELHSAATWRTIRQGSLEVPSEEKESFHDEGADRRSWLGYRSKKEEQEASNRFRDEKLGIKSQPRIEELKNGYEDFADVDNAGSHKLTEFVVVDHMEGQETNSRGGYTTEEQGWVDFWVSGEK